MSEERHYFFGGMMFMLGLTIGIGAGFLLAPRSGRDTRRQIKGLADETGTHLGRIADETKQVFSGVVKHGKEMAKETGGHLDNITQEAKQTADKIAAHGKGLMRDSA
ncbi:MAG: YtxH domain-containing protein [Candidatus Manganitrophus sp. SB1]|nr:YtxH domain-containing protein [Candidatus Manganitrophus morganii]